MRSTNAPHGPCPEGNAAFQVQRFTVWVKKQGRTLKVRPEFNTLQARQGDPAGQGLLHFDFDQLYAFDGRFLNLAFHDHHHTAIRGTAFSS